jgi:predicted nucleic acid-binding protein
VDQIETAATDAGVDAQQTDAIVVAYADAQLQSLKVGLLVTGVLVLLSLSSTRNLPSEVKPPTDAAADETVPV